MITIQIETERTKGGDSLPNLVMRNEPQKPEETMKYPKFKVGQQVALVSRFQPHRNGVFTVRKIAYDAGYTWDGSSGFRYKLDVKGDDGRYWCESSLRRLNA